eukprot:2554609-Rhodomonas_salina.4
MLRSGIVLRVSCQYKCYYWRHLPSRYSSAIHRCTDVGPSRYYLATNARTDTTVARRHQCIKTGTCNMNGWDCTEFTG